MCLKGNVIPLDLVLYMQAHGHPVKPPKLDARSRDENCRGYMVKVLHGLY